ncbi:TIGR03364 family FAD-dependent oxidoreductase [Murinocardiopsis flavida]|uniref:TIGR03364 family FAD-dependent oxidoreductase n=1 Tax=Murinocardiopsis flavida TaxID=645275 RepID=UPI000D0DAFAE|nr:TIGR03364 family FAD-dependent oxidoreductase [Murinocardiopsis flavida]
MSTSSTPLTGHPRSDLVVVGAGIVGLAHAVDAHDRGLSVTVVERSSHAVGASVRNFGHGCVTAQTGENLRRGRAARERWIALAERTGLWLARSGAVAVARDAAEMAVLAELAEQRGPGEVDLLTSAQVEERVPGVDPATTGGALLPQDIRVDPRNAVHRIAEWLAAQPGVRMVYDTAVTGVGDGVVHTARGDLACERAVVCAGHEVDALFPEAADAAGLHQCALQMLLVDSPRDRTFAPAVLTGTSLVRYPAFAGTESGAALRARFRQRRPELLAAGVNLMFTQRPDGALLIGDTHTYAPTVEPFLGEDHAELLLDEAARLLGTGPLRVRQRWQGVYAASTATDLLVAAPSPRVRAVTVTSGIGMTIALGTAPDILDDLLA